MPKKKIDYDQIINLYHEINRARDLLPHETDRLEEIIRKKNSAEASRRYREKNREMLNEKRRLWSKNNPEKNRDRSRAWREKYPLSSREASRKWRKKMSNNIEKSILIDDNNGS